MCTVLNLNQLNAVQQPFCLTGIPNLPSAHVTERYSLRLLRILQTRPEVFSVYFTESESFACCSAALLSYTESAISTCDRTISLNVTAHSSNSSVLAFRTANWLEINTSELLHKGALLVDIYTVLHVFGLPGSMSCDMHACTCSISMTN